MPRNNLEIEIVSSLINFFINNVKIKKDNKLLIIADETTDPRVYSFIGIAAHFFIPTGNVAVYIFKKPAGFHYHFPAGLVKLLKEADVIISPTSISIYHAAELQNSLNKKKKFFSMTGATIETLYKYGAQANFEKIGKTAESLKQLITGCERISVMSENGTHFSASIKGRKANMETSIGQFGKSATFPDIEVNTSIIEESGEGKIVADGAATGLGILSEPVEFIVEKGKIISIKGGKEAKAASAVLKKLADPNMYQIAEIGIGLNPFSRIYGCIIEDEAVYGTSHFGIGQNIFMGGKNKAKTHLDFVLRKPRIFLDGCELILGDEAILYKGKSVGKIFR